MNKIFAFFFLSFFSPFVFGKDPFADFDFEALLKELGGFEEEDQSFSSLFEDESKNSFSQDEPSFQQSPPPASPAAPKKIVKKDFSSHFLDSLDKETDLDEKNNIIKEKKESFIYFAQELVGVCSLLSFYLQQYDSLPSVPFTQSSTASKKSAKSISHLLFQTKAEEVIRILSTFIHESDVAQTIHLNRFFDKQSEKSRKEMKELIEKLSSFVKTVKKEMDLIKNEEVLTLESSYKKPLTHILKNKIIPELQKIENGPMTSLYNFLRSVETGSQKSLESEKKKREDAYRQFASRQRGSYSPSSGRGGWGGEGRDRGGYGRYGNDDFGYPYNEGRYDGDSFHPYDGQGFDKPDDLAPPSSSSPGSSPTDKSSAPSSSPPKKRKEEKSIFSAFEHGGSLHEIVSLMLKLNTPPSAPYSSSLFTATVGKILSHELLASFVEKLEEIQTLLSSKRKKIIFGEEEKEKKEDSEKKDSSGKEEKEKETEKKKKEYEAEEKKFVYWCEQCAMPAIRLQQSFVPLISSEEIEQNEEVFVPKGYFEKGAVAPRNVNFFREIVDRLVKITAQGGSRVFGKAQALYGEYVEAFEQERKEQFSSYVSLREEFIVNLKSNVEILRATLSKSREGKNLETSEQRAQYVKNLEIISEKTSPSFKEIGKKAVCIYVFLYEIICESAEDFGQLYRGNNDSNPALRINIRIEEEAKALCTTLHKILWGFLGNALADYTEYYATSRSFSFFKEARNAVIKHLKEEKEKIETISNALAAQQIAYFCLFSVYLFQGLGAKSEVYGVFSKSFENGLEDLKDLWSLKQPSQVKNIHQLFLGFSSEKIASVWKIKEELKNEEEKGEDMPADELIKKREQRHKEIEIYQTALSLANKEIEEEKKKFMSALKTSSTSFALSGDKKSQAKKLSTKNMAGAKKDISPTGFLGKLYSTVRKWLFHGS